MLAKQWSVPTLVLIVKCGHNQNWWVGASEEGSKQALWLPEGSVWPPTIQRNWRYKSKVEYKRVQYWLCCGGTSKRFGFTPLSSDKDLRRDKSPRSEIWKGIKVTILLFQLHFVAKTCKTHIWRRKHILTAACIFLICAMIDDEGGGENVIGYLEGKGDNHLSNPPSYPLGPITWDRMALSSAVSQLTPSQTPHLSNTRSFTL